jgi:hypothetical protein
MVVRACRCAGGPQAAPPGSLDVAFACKILEGVSQASQDISKLYRVVASLVKVLVGGVALEVTSNAHKQGRLDAPDAAFICCSCISEHLLVRFCSITR